MKNLVLLFLLLFSVMIISAQKKLPEPKTDTYTISRYYPRGDGYILSNLNFKSKVVLKQPGREKFAWGAVVYHKHNNMSIDGYVYKGITYSANELLSEFNINLKYENAIVYLRIKVVFSNGKNYSSSIGAVGAHYTFDYIDNDENTNFGLSSISIINNPKSNNIEGTIKRAIAIKEQKRINEELRKKEEERLRVEEENKKIEDDRLQVEAQKKEEERLKQLELENKKNESLEKRFEEEKKEANRQAEIKANERKEDLRLKKEAIDRNLEIEQKRIEKESADNAAVRRRLAKRRKEAEDKKIKADLKKVEKNTATAFTGIFNGLSDGSISYVRGGIGIRTVEDSNSFYLSTPSNMTYEIGIEGFYMGFGLPDSIYDESSGFSWTVGIDYFFYELEDINLEFGFNGEFGMGELDETDYNNNGSVSFNRTEDAIFYSFGAQIMLGKVLYVSYNYGFYSGESRRSINNGSASVEEGKGNFTKLGLGLALSF